MNDKMTLNCRLNIKYDFIFNESSILILYNLLYESAIAGGKTMGIMKNNMSTNVRKLIIRYSPLLLLAVMLSFILSKLIVIGSEIISNSINVMISGEQIYMKELFLKMGMIIIISMIISFLQSFFSGIFGVRVQKECKNQIIEAVEKADCLLLNHTGSVLNKLTSDITDMGKLLSELLPEIIQYGVTIIVIGIAILKMNWIIFAGVIVILPISLFISNRIAVRLGALAKKRRGKYDELSNIALDSIGGIEIAKSYCIEKLLGKRVHEKAEEILKNEYARNRYQALANGLIMLIKWVPTIICSLIALAMVLNRTISIGELMAFIVLFNKIFNPMSELPFRIMDAKEMMISVKRIERLMSTEPEKSGNNEETKSNNTENVIELKSISFSYDMKTSNNNLENVSMFIRKGEKIALVGASGSGKSTLLKMLCGFIRAQNGVYNLYGHNIDEWNIDAARKYIAYVSQEIYLFPETIAENISYGDFYTDISRVKKVCKLAGIYDMIVALPEGFNTKLGERGITISGGERQRIAIARALYKDAPIIIMDEPTSALDEKTQEIVSRVIYQNKDKTVIVAAHRLSTIKNADRIYCFANGKISEAGKHDELMLQNGIYAELYGKEVLK